MPTTKPAAPPASQIGRLLDFAWNQTRACAFALLSGVTASKLLPRLPVARYDLLVAYGVLLTLLFWRRGWESGRDVAVFSACHVIGLASELVKVSQGSWSYPEPAVLKFAGVPLYGGFLYAAVGSYVCRAWHLFDLELCRYRPRAAGLLAAVTAGTSVRFTVCGVQRSMPLALSFVLIGFFLWVAENLATSVGAWRYPYQLHGWQPVGVGKFGAWPYSSASRSCSRHSAGRGHHRLPGPSPRRGDPHPGTMPSKETEPGDAAGWCSVPDAGVGSVAPPHLHLYLHRKPI